MVYLISDIHGDYNRFLSLIQNRVDPSKDHLYILGDLINRGDDSIAVLKYAQRNTSFITTLKGNHELFLELYLSSPQRLPRSLYQAYGGNPDEIDVLDDEEKESLLSFVKNLKTYAVVKDSEGNEVVLSHTGPSLDCLVENRDGSINVLKSIEKLASWNEWDLLLNNDIYYAGKNILERLDRRLYVGHYPTFNFSSKEGFIYEGPYFTGLDCGGCFRNLKGRLGLYCLDMKEAFYI